MFDQLGDERQPQRMQHVEQHSRVLVQLIGDLEEPRAPLSSGEIARIPQVQPSSSGVDVHNDNFVSAQVDAQARLAGCENEWLARYLDPMSNTHLPNRVEPPRRTRLGFASIEIVMIAKLRTRADPTPSVTTLPSQGCPHPKRARF